MSRATLPENVKVHTVSELTREIKGLMEDAFPYVWLAAEISNLSTPSSGHIYLTLKDSEAQIRAVIWRTVAFRLRCDLRDGLDVIVRGRLTVYPPKGEYQFVVDQLQPKGVGALELALRQLKEKLFRAGFFAPERKKPLPPFPKRVALVTSPSGAAVRDMLQIFARRWPPIEVWVCPVRVQGEGAGFEIAAAIEMISRGGHADVIIVGRGGGSSEDLWAFNEECVARAIFASQVPIVSAVGHEIDVTIADLVADRRALTPSEAAEIVVPCLEEYVDWLRDTAARLERLIGDRFSLARRRLDDLAERRVLRQPLERIRTLEMKLDDNAERLGRSIRTRLERCRERLETQTARLEALSPLNVLGRGYTVTRRETDLAVVRSTTQVRPGDRLLTLVPDGRVVSRVEEANSA
jgi:exodeoxyribonuclease VII large subunit